MRSETSLSENRSITADENIQKLMHTQKNRTASVRRSFVYLQIMLMTMNNSRSELERGSIEYGFIVCMNASIVTFSLAPWRQSGTSRR